ncbi:MAG TPA: hypothetical protein VH702_06110 [Vicinamibacterales bacterium]|jgi:hypothetical protein
MNTRIVALAGVMVVVCLAAAPVAAQSTTGVARASATADPWSPPRTAWGDPDLQGIWPSANIAGTPFERPTQFGDRKLLSDEEFAARQKEFAANEQRVRNTIADGARVSAPPDGDTGGGPAHWGEGWLRTPNKMTSLIVDPPDGRFPPVTPEGRHRAANSWRSSFGDGPWYGPEDLGPYDRCISRGLLGSMFPSAYNNGNQILQAPGLVAIRNEMVHETRIIPLDGRPHASGALRGYMGDSRGRWEGKTLVVETTNFNGRFGARGNGNNNPMSSAARVVERFTRVDADTLQYEVTVEDPGTWTRPWTVAYPMKLDPNYVMFEYACHEGNYGLTNILSGARADEKKQ